jgi:hypothetical protein
MLTAAHSFTSALAISLSLTAFARAKCLLTQSLPGLLASPSDAYNPVINAHRPDRAIVAFALKIDKGEEREQTADKKPHVSVPSRRASTRHSRVESKRRKGGAAELSQNNVKAALLQ